MGDKFFMDFPFFAHRFFKENLWNFFSQMPDALGICGTMYKVKIEENLFLWKIWLPSQNARTRVRLLYQKSDNISDGKVSYEDIFSNNVKKQKQVTDLYENLLEIRKKIISSLPVACTGPVQSIPTLQNHPVLSTQIFVVWFWESNENNNNTKNLFINMRA